MSEPRTSAVPYLGARLRERREAAALSREEVAVAIGRSWPSIRSYELGSSTPPLDVLIALADLFNVSAGTLIDPPTRGRVK